MKSLKQFLLESKITENCDDCKTITFNFAGMDNKEDVLKQLGEIENCTVEDDKVTINVCKDCPNTKKAYDILKAYSDAQRSSQHRSSDEQYAQKTVAFEKNVDEMNDFMNEEPAEDEPSKEDEKADDKKDDKKDNKE